MDDVDRRASSGLYGASNVKRDGSVVLPGIHAGPFVRQIVHQANE